ncbi:hypothetical protein MMC34_006018 [Xylographa carneopallida]|nr:hypothetical protein [Xylographa carneopallida]
MGFFGKRKSGHWHQKIDSIAAGKHPLEVGLKETTDLIPVLNATYPWTQLRLQTDLYLKTKSQLELPQRDGRLAALFLEHGAKDVAMAACGHAMSPQTLRKMLTDNLNTGVHNYCGWSPLSSLQITVIANHVNSNAVSEIEAHCARVLIPFSGSNSVADVDSLEAILQLLIVGVPRHSLLFSKVEKLARKIFANCGTRLGMLSLNNEWLQAHTLTVKLMESLENSAKQDPDNLQSKELVDDLLPNWRSWAQWKPLVHRLHLWEELQSPDRRALQDLLSLEGPDFMDGRQPTLRAGLMARGSGECSIRKGQLLIESRSGSAYELRNMLDRLLEALDTTCHTAFNETTLRLFTHFCVNKPVDEAALTVLERVTQMQDTSLSAMVLQIVEVHGRSIHMDGLRQPWLLRSLQVLGRAYCQALREVLAPYLINNISQHVQGLRALAQKQINSDTTWYDTALELQALGKGLQEALWLHPSLDATLKASIEVWPTVEFVQILHAIRAESKALTMARVADCLVRKIDSYCMDCLIVRGSLDQHTKYLVETLVQLWQHTPDVDRRALSLRVAHDSDISSDVRCRCLTQLLTASVGFVHEFLELLDSYDKNADAACIGLARLLVSTPEVLDDWRPILLRMIVNHDLTLTEYALTHLRAQRWLQWIEDLSSIFGDTMEWHPSSSAGSLSPIDSLPAVLQPSLHIWAQRLTMYLPAIIRLENASEPKAVPQYFLRDHRGAMAETLITILDLLDKCNEQHYEAIVYATVAHTRDDNARTVRETICLIRKATLDASSVCLRLLELQKRTSRQVVEVMLTGWLQASELSPLDHCAVESFAQMLGFTVNDLSNSSTASLDAAARFLDDEVADLLAEARHLENLRLFLQKEDPYGTSLLSATLGIEEPSPLDDAIACLPQALVDVVEKIGEQEVELHFPLTHLKDLQRKAMGVGNAKSLFVRLVYVDSEKRQGFCVHLDNESEDPEYTLDMDALSKDTLGNLAVSSEATLTSEGHPPWLVFEGSSVPDVFYCHGRANSTTYQIARTLARYLQGGHKSLEAIHNLVSTSLTNLFQTCIVCGSSQGTRLHRATVCRRASCNGRFGCASLEIRLADIRHDPPVIDLLLTAVHSVTESGRVSLLPDCPIRTTTELLQILDKLPKTKYLQYVRDLNTSIRRLGTSTEVFFPWLCGAYHGFLASATGLLRIPSMPGIHQFILASASPTLESVFATHAGQRSPRLLFHGTSMDRLYAILCQGLRVCSGTSLQLHGSSYGAGIYMAEEPKTAYSYATASVVSGSGWTHSAYPYVRVLLGCEYIGASQARSTNGIHVITDASELMVRYVFLLPPGVSPPLAAHVAPAMMSVFASLRSQTPL